MEILTRTFYLGVWNTGNSLSDRQAAKIYGSFSEEGTLSRFDEAVYRFYSSLTRYYPETDMLAEEDLESSPWACAMDVAGDHIVIPMMPDRYAEVFPLILELANTHGLVCFDPQNVKVHLPAHLNAQKALHVADTVQACKVGSTGSVPAKDQVVIAVAPRASEGRVRAAVHALLQLIL